MPNFTYKARQNGQIVQQNTSGHSESEVRRRLREQGLMVISVKEKRPVTLRLGRRRRLSLRDKMIITEQLAVMIKAGLSVSKALQSLASEITNKDLAVMINEIAASVDGGSSFSEALHPYHDAFGEVYIQMVKAGERGGKLDEVLGRVAQQLEKDADIRSKVRSALIYPIIVLILMVAVIVIIMIFVIPRLATVFIEANVELPLATKVLITISNLFVKSWPIMLLLLIGAMVGLRLLLRYHPFILLWDTMKVRIPIMGPFVSRVYLAHFSLSFASLLSSGLPILDIMSTSRNVVDNEAWRADITAARTKIENGVPIARALHESPYFPNTVAQLVSVGERSGSLDEIMWVISRFYEKEVDNMTRNLSTALEPIIMVGLGLGVAFILIAVLQPMYSLVNAI